MSFIGYAITRTEREMSENDKIRDFREFSLKNRALNAFRKCIIIEKEERLENYHYIMQFKLKQIVKKWHELIPVLRENNIIREEKIVRVIDQFRLTKLGPKVIKAWKMYTEDEKKEKEKQKFTSQMWDKVNCWLAEIDEQSGIIPTHDND